MDKYEKKVRIDQIESLMRQGEFAEAVSIADSIDWRTEKKIRTLRMVSEVYKINKRYEDAFQVLMIAYDKNPDDPIKKKIVYDLCELTIKMRETAYAVKFFKEYVMLSPRDPGRYILQYKLYKEQEVAIDERIAVLEEFKEKYYADFREKWAYELAYLYHTSGQEGKCVDECDELILWFVKGPYVTKAMELKMQHTALSQDQQYKYDHRLDGETKEPLYIRREPKVKKMTHDDNSAPVSSAENEVPYEDGSSDEKLSDTNGESADNVIPIEIKRVDASNEPTIQFPSKIRPGEKTEEISVNLDKYSTINLQAELKANMDRLQQSTGELLREKEEKIPEPDEGMTEIKFAAADKPERKSEQYKEEHQTTEPVPEVYSSESETTGSEPDAAAEKTGFANMLSEEYDGQISLNVPDMPAEIEKQITGQLDIATVLEHWDKMKEESTARRVNAAKRKSLEQTNDIASQLVGVIPGFEVPALPPEEQSDEQEDGQEQTEEIKFIQKEEQVKKTAAKSADPEPEDTDEGIDEIEEIIDDSEEPSDEEEIAGKEPEKLPVAEELVSEQEAAAVPEIKPEPVKPEAVKMAAVSADVPSGVKEPVSKKEQTKVKEPADEKVSAGSNKEVHERKIEDIPKPVDVKELDAKEKEIFADYLSMHGLADKILDALKNISMTACIGNMFIYGNEQSARTGLAYAFAKEEEQKNPLFDGKIAKISAGVFNTKDIVKSMKALNGGALVIENAGNLSAESMDTIGKALNDPELALLIIFEDARNISKELSKQYDWFQRMFPVRLEIPTYTNDDLVFHGREYAKNKEYAIDELGILALYRRIDELQTAEHAVNLQEVEDIVEEAIHNVDKKSMSHLCDVLFAKRYDENDLIIIREKDFIKK